MKLASPSVRSPDRGRRSRAAWLLVRTFAKLARVLEYVAIVVLTAAAITMLEFLLSISTLSLATTVAIGLAWAVSEWRLATVVSTVAATLAFARVIAAGDGLAPIGYVLVTHLAVALLAAISHRRRRFAARELTVRAVAAWVLVARALSWLTVFPAQGFAALLLAVGFGHLPLAGRMLATPPGAARPSRPLVTVTLGLLAAGLLGSGLPSPDRRAADCWPRTRDVPGALTIVTLGDSSAHDLFLPRFLGLSAVLESLLEDELGRDVAVTSCARDGADTTSLLAEQLPAVDALDPDLVVVYVGINDGRDVWHPARYRSNLARLARHNARAGRTTVIASYGFGSAFHPDWVGDMQAAAAETRVRRVVTADTAARLGKRAWLFTPDNFHPNQWGHARIARTLAGAILEHLASPPGAPASPGGR